MATITSASPEDLPATLELLENCSLPREAVSPAINASVEWTSACPESAQAMVLELLEASGKE